MDSRDPGLAYAKFINLLIQWDRLGDGDVGIRDPLLNYAKAMSNTHESQEGMPSPIWTLLVWMSNRQKRSNQGQEADLSLFAPILIAMLERGCDFVIGSDGDEYNWWHMFGLLNNKSLARPIAEGVSTSRHAVLFGMCADKLDLKQLHLLDEIIPKWRSARTHVAQIGLWVAADPIRALERFRSLAHPEHEDWFINLLASGHMEPNVLYPNTYALQSNAVYLQDIAISSCTLLAQTVLMGNEQAFFQLYAHGAKLDGCHAQVDGVDLDFFKLIELIASRHGSEVCKPFESLIERDKSMSEANALIGSLLAR